jgi:hypothetical protein
MAEILRIDFESMSEQSCFACVFPDELADAQRHFARSLARPSALRFSFAPRRWIADMGQYFLHGDVR